jgi:hypothetical protein
VTQVCPVCGTRYGADEFLCPEDLSELAAYQPPAEQPDQGTTEAPAPDTPAPDATAPEAKQVLDGEPWSTAVCWNCGTPSANAQNTECLNPQCRRPLVPPALHIRFETGEVQLEPGTRTELGRQGPHSRVFESYPNVSRRHAVVGVEWDGRAWIEPVPTPNGTFVNGTEIPESSRYPLRNRDTVRLARDATGHIRVYRR